MLLRTIPGGRICITQPAHAWVSGQLARAWGNTDQTGTFSPWRDVCLAAEQHDIGWLSWEATPQLNPETGYPYHFTELPIPTHMGIWSDAKRLSLSLGRYVSLLVSLHGTGLYERFTSWQQSSDRHLVEKFLHDEKAYQHELVGLLKTDVYYESSVSRSVIERNRQLIATWDWLSILMCIGFEGSKQVPDVPMTEGVQTLTLTSIPSSSKSDAEFITVTPWVFQDDSVSLKVEGRVLYEAQSSDAAMRQALDEASWATLNIVLTPG
ncbi:MAG: DUF3891 family protein [Elainellaceae cyanobacterium]